MSQLSGQTDERHLSRISLPRNLVVEALTTTHCSKRSHRGSGETNALRKTFVDSREVIVDPSPCGVDLHHTQSDSERSGLSKSDSGALAV